MEVPLGKTLRNLEAGVAAEVAVVAEVDLPIAGAGAGLVAGVAPLKGHQTQTPIITKISKKLMRKIEVIKQRKENTFNGERQINIFRNMVFGIEDNIP